MKPNPCVLCGNQPTVGPWSDDKGYAAHCYNNLDTHAVECYGKNQAAAVRRWNRLNPRKEKA